MLHCVQISKGVGKGRGRIITSIMKTALFTATLLATCQGMGQTLPVITSSPANVTVLPGNTAAFTVTATGANGYQWLFDGTNIAGATGATLQIANAQSTNCGYYLALATNSSGWVPSQMAYLTLDYTRGATQPTACGTLSFSTMNNHYDSGNVVDYISEEAITNATVQMIVGPELDEMHPVGRSIPYQLGFFINGYYVAPDQPVATVSPGQLVYYWINVYYTNSGAWFQPSTVMRIAAGTNGTAAPSCFGLLFPLFDATSEFVPNTLPQMPNLDPWQVEATPASATGVPGETFNFVVNYEGYSDYGIAQVQWRKDGAPVAGATNYILTGVLAGQSSFSLTNLQPSDAGIYDLIIYGNIYTISKKLTLSLQTTNGQGVFGPPEIAGTNLLFSLAGAAGRNYEVQYSTNLLNWLNLTTLSNITGTVTFTNPALSAVPQFYRTLLMPF
jgi:hypothetical protein